MFPVRLAVRESDAHRALAILDAPFTNDDFEYPDDDYPATHR
jgi:hypothetical protein